MNEQAEEQAKTRSIYVTDADWALITRQAKAQGRNRSAQIVQWAKEAEKKSDE